MKNQLPCQLFKFIMYFLKKYRGGIFSLFLFSGISGAYGTINSYLSKVLIDQVASLGVGESNFLQILFWPVILFILNFEIHNISWSLMKYINIQVSPMLRNQVIEEMFAYVQQHSIRFFQENFSGNIGSNINRTAENIELIIHDLGPFIFRGIVQLVLAIFAVYFVHLFFSIMLLLWAAIFLMVNLSFSRKIKKLSDNYAESQAVLAGKITDSIVNMSNVILFSRQTFENIYLQKYLNICTKKFRHKDWFLLKLWFFQGASITLLLGAMIFFLIYLRKNNAVTIGDFSLIIGLSLYVTDNVWYIANQFDRVNEAVGQCVQSLKTLIISHEIIDPIDAKVLQVSKGEIVFHNISFNYDHCSNNIFQNRSIIIPGGQKVGLVGYSGSGKTTFVNLMARLYDLSHGSIIIDNQDISQVTQDSLRESISFIPQEPSLFHRTVIENIRYGNLNSTDEEVVLAAKKAHAHDFITMMPDGYNSLVGERGIKLSGGQRQRISIARAVLKNAPILILDEATSALDSINEGYIQESLKELMKGKTVIVIAHRLSTLLDMDRILVFSDGIVIEDGTHSELITNNSLYSLLWKKQVDGFMHDELSC